MKLIKELTGVPAGAVYPVTFAAGDDCPPELMAAAVALGCVDAKAAAEAEAKLKAGHKAAAKTAAEAEANNGGVQK